MITAVSRYLLFALTSLILAMGASAQSLIRDTEIEHTLRDWTNPILDVAGLNPDDVGLYIINDPSLNAFVANGQNIHLHTGLIIAAESPGQIKGVIGHETCHIACGHTVSRSQAAAVSSRPALVSIGLGILAIAAGAGDAGAALIASSQQFAALNFFRHTRAEEAAADQAAVAYLSQLGESPRGLVEFFENYRYQEVLSDARRYPYFRAHPLASDRIRTTRQLAEETGLMDVEADPETLHEFDMMQAKLIGFLQPPPQVFRRYPQTDQSMPARYARAVAYMQAADMGQAVNEIDSLIEEEPDNPYFHELKGDILFDAGRVAEAVPSHQRAVELMPNQPLLEIRLAQTLAARAEEGDFAEAEDALRSALLVEPGNAFAWRQMAVVMERQGRTPEAQLATAESAYYIGDLARANVFAGRARNDLESGTPLYRRASDILAITDPRLPENRPFYRNVRN
ncbi:MAG: M48 family metalloprotease [Hyphomonadaceae bacterium]|nr:M48 family metalloprotease [Hyphomonadaceae bacterium]